MKTLLLLSTVLIGNAALAAPPSGGDWNQIWNDEFSGSSLDSSKWDTGWLKLRATDGSFSAYHRAATNARVTGGNLESVYTRPNTNNAYAAYATTNGKFGTTYGYFEIRMQVTDQAGSQSAFWMMPFVDANSDGQSGLPENNTVNNSAVDGAEIDIMESKGLPNDYSAGIICDGYATSPPPCSDTRDDTISATGFRNGYKTWALNWTPEKMEFLYEGQVKHTLTANNRIVHVPERLILSGAANAGLKNNLSVGQENASGKTDWIRVHKDNEMDWGDGYFKIINRGTGKALTGQSSGYAIPATFQNGNNAQLWQVEKGGSCSRDLYALKSKAHGNYVKADDQITIIPQGFDPEVKMAGNAVCEWSITFEENDSGSDYYYITSYDGVYSSSLYMSDTHTSSTHITQAPQVTSGNKSEWQIIWVEN